MKFIRIIIALLIVLSINYTVSRAQDPKPAAKDTVITVSVKNELLAIEQREQQLTEMLKELEIQKNFLLQLAQDSLKVRVRKNAN